MKLVYVVRRYVEEFKNIYIVFGFYYVGINVLLNIWEFYKMGKINGFKLVRLNRNEFKCKIDFIYFELYI